MRFRRRAARRVAVHIGTHKTGTTAFQRYLLEHRAFFAGRGLHLHVHETGAPQAHELALLALRPELCIPLRVRNPDLLLEEARAGLEAAIAATLDEVDSGTVLFSHEALSFLRTPGETETLRSLFPDDEVEVVVMLRDRTDYLESWRAQLDRMGFATSSPYRSSFMYTEPDSWLADQDALLAVFRETFGEERVTVLSYEEALERDASVVPALLEAVGASTEGIPSGWDALRNTRSERSEF